MKRDYVKLVTFDFDTKEEYEDHCIAWTFNDEPWWEQHPTGIDEHQNFVRVWWSVLKDQAIDDTEVETPSELLSWLAYLIEQDDEVTSGRIYNFIRCFEARKGWVDFAPPGESSNVVPIRQTSDMAERAKLTPKLRWQILERDERTCQGCGASVATGAILHIDHIKPISRGGRTVEGNLQTLCSGCNHGKGAR